MMKSFPDFNNREGRGEQYVYELNRLYSESNLKFKENGGCGGVSPRIKKHQ
jgi:hypothetical protein